MCTPHRLGEFPCSVSSLGNMNHGAEPKLCCMQAISTMKLGFHSGGILQRSKCMLHDNSMAYCLGVMAVLSGYILLIL